MATKIPQNSASFLLSEVCKAVNGTLVGDDRRTTGVVTDSRLATADTLFVALAGERFDAHDFVPSVAQRGSALIVRRGTSIPPGVSAVVVQDTLVALGDLAHLHRQSFSGDLIAITGSVGKTSTKELLAGLLTAAGRSCLSTPGNLNNRVGVPMVLLTLGPDTDTAVIELGTSERGEIARLCEIAEPTVGVLTAVAASHSAGLGTLADVAKEKCALLRSLPDASRGVFPSDDAAVLAELTDEEQSLLFGFGGKAPASLQITGWDLTETFRTRCNFLHAGQKLECELQLLGEGAVRNAAAALLAAQMVGLEVSSAVAHLSTVASPAGRLCLTQSLAGVWVLDDTYNSSPRSLHVALETAARIGAKLNRSVVAVLGDMLELGDDSRQHHVEVGRAAAALGVRTLIACGDQMASAAQAALRAGVSSVHSVPDSDSAIEIVHDQLVSGDLVLVKGSRSMRMERVVQALLGEEAPRAGRAAPEPRRSMAL